MNESSLSFVDVEDALTKLDVKNVSSNGDEVQFSCPYPEHKNGDRNPSASMNKNTTAWHCFSCHRSGNIVTFLVEQENISPIQALLWLREAYDNSFIEPKGSMVSEIENFFAEKKEAVASTTNPVVTDSGPVSQVKWDLVASNKADAPKAMSYMLDRGFTQNTLIDHQISYDPLSDRVAIPVRNEKGGLVGYKARTPYENISPRYLVLGDRQQGSAYGFEPCKLSLEIFNLHKFPSGEVVVCEGELDAMMLCQIGYKAIALSGSNLSKKQISLLSGRYSSLILFLDSDEAGAKCEKTLCDVLHSSIKIKCVDQHIGDPCDLSPDICRYLIDNAKSPLINNFNRE